MPNPLAMPKSDDEILREVAGAGDRYDVHAAAYATG